MRSSVRGVWAAAFGAGVLSFSASALAQATGIFADGSGWFVSPAGPGVELVSDTRIRLDRDKDGLPDTEFDLPLEIRPDAASTQPEYLLSPQQDILCTRKSSGCGSGEARVFFHRVGMAPDLVGFGGDQGACLAGPIADGPLFFDTPGSPVQTAVVLGAAELGKQAVVWADLINGVVQLDASTYNDGLARPQFAPSGHAALLASDLTTLSARYYVVDLCKNRLAGADALSIGPLPIDAGVSAHVVQSGPDYFAQVRIENASNPPHASVPLDVSCFATAPTGACCIDGSCTDTPADACSGTFHHGQSCASGICGQSTEYALHILLAGPGSGVVYSSPANIFCPGVCDATFAADLSVGLTAIADSGSAFAGWSGDCTGTSDSTFVTIDEEKTCTAHFDLITADLALMVTDLPDPVVAGTSLKWELTVSNGQPYGATGVTVSGPLPAGLVFDANGSSPGCGQFGNNISCNIGDVPAGGAEVRTIAVIVKPETRGAVEVTLTVAGQELDPALGNNTALATTDVQAVTDLAVTMKDTPDPVEGGRLVIYEIVVANSGPSTATDVIVADTLPTGVAQLDGAGNPLPAGPANCHVGTIAPGASTKVTIVGQVDAAIPAGTLLNNAVTVSLNEPDPNAGNDAASVDTMVAAAGPPALFRRFVRIVAPGTAVPDGSGSFLRFDPPIMARGFVGLRAVAAGQEGIYRWIDGHLVAVADRSTFIPGTAVRFTSFIYPSMSGLDIAVNGGRSGSPTQKGIFATSPCVLHAVVDQSRINPTTNASLDNGIFDFDFRNGTAAFWAGGPSPGSMLLADRGSVELIANGGTPIPGGTGGFTAFGAPAFDGVNVAFSGDGGEIVDFRREQRGLYAFTNGSLVRIADLTTPIPGGSGNFFAFGISNEDLAIDAGQIAFFATDSALRPGIYVADLTTGAIRVIADTNTRIPGSMHNFDRVVVPTISNGRVAFLGSRQDGEELGIYLHDGHRLRTVVKHGEPLEAGENADFPLISRQSLSGDQLAFRIGSSQLNIPEAIYIANLSLVPTDYDDDRDVDGDDVAYLQGCATGPAIAQPDPACRAADLDEDGDVDQSDFAMLQRCYSGADQPADPECVRN